MKKTVIAISLCFFLANADGYSETINNLKDEDFLLLHGWARWEDNRPTLRNYLNDKAFEQLDRRENAIRNLRGPDRWRKRIAETRQHYLDILGEMPERTPLNARIVGTLENEYCRIEKIIFESRPEMYVTSCLFIPKDLQEPRPAVLYVCGHSELGYRSEAYQHVILNLVKKGFVVLAMDPVGQGERLMYYDEENKKSKYGPTGEHSYVGKQTFLTGVSLGSYFVWDMVRALDYLETRPEVDAKRIAVHGRSGGGTQSAYLMAYDDRVAIGAPECYITSLRRLLQSIGPQDAEQCFYRWIASGLDLTDLLEMRAPKPTLVITTTNDFFNITGAQEVVTEAQIAYSALGVPERLVLAQDDAIHESTRRNRETLYDFLRKHFYFPGSTEDETVAVFPPEQLNCTETGQVLTSLGGKTVFDYGHDYAVSLSAKLQESRKDAEGHSKRVRAAVHRLAGYERPYLFAAAPTMVKRIALDGYVLEKWTIEVEKNLLIPVLLAVPEKAQGASERLPVTLLFSDKGKADRKELIEKLALSGQVVLAADLAGIGETASGNREYQDPYLALWLGIGIPGIRATQISCCINFLEGLPFVDSRRIAAVGLGATGSAVLHAAAMDERIGRIALLNGLSSYQRIVLNRSYQFDSGELIGGVLTEYDLPDLVGLLSPRPAFLAGMRGHTLEPLPVGDLDADLAFARESYGKESASNCLCADQVSDATHQVEALQDWLVQ